MKTSLLIIALTMFFVNAEAQYKKASFLNKTGRIYDIGITGRLQNGGRSSSPGFFLAYGKESTEKRIHHWYDMELALGNKYSYSSTVSGSSNKVQVSGKSRPDFSFRYNLAYFLADNSSEDAKLLPFINIGIGYVTSGLSIDSYTLNPDNGNYPEVTPLSSRGSLTYGGGGGILYKLNANIGIRASVAYYGVSNLNNTDMYSQTYFLTLANHPAVSLAIRFRMDRDE
jgi:hypothetical protein